MLFKQIYNWIKYKTLPPSFLFKNRLFIERDSKNKRIFNNLGLTFRNSKWTSFEMSNIQSHFKSQYLRFTSLTLLLIFTLLYLWKFDQFYLCSYVFNSVFFVFWSGLDLFDYYWTFLFWFGFTVFSFLSNFAQSYLFFNNFPPRRFRAKDTNSLSVKFGPDQLNVKTSSVSRKDHKWLIFSWLNTGNVSNSNRLNAVKTLFNNAINRLGWSHYFDFFTDLYRLDLFLIVNRDFATLRLCKYNTQRVDHEKDLKPLTYKTTSTLNSTHSDLFLAYLMESYLAKDVLNRSKVISLNHLMSGALWNLANYSRMETNYDNLLKNVNGLFYIHNLSYGTLMSYCNTTLNISQNMIATQLNSAKWDRWLYKYSLLHRKIFKNSHKLTLSKKLLNSAFYNTDLTKKNLWYSELLNKHTNLNLLHFTTNLFQFNLANVSHFDFKQNKNTVITNNTRYRDNLFMLKTHENSFFWFLKRSYFFTTLLSNSKYSTTIQRLNLNNVTPNFSAQDSYFTVYSFLINNIFMNLTAFSYLNTDLSKSLRTCADLKHEDLFLVFNDWDLFEKDNLEILISLTHLPVSLEHQSVIPYFSYFEFLTPNFQNAITFRTNNWNNIKLNNDFIFILNKNNLFHLNDILVLLNIR